MAENLQGEEDMALNKSWKLALTLWGSEGKVVKHVRCFNMITMHTFDYKIQKLTLQQITLMTVSTLYRFI